MERDPGTPSERGPLKSRAQVIVLIALVALVGVVGAGVAVLIAPALRPEPIANGTAPIDLRALDEREALGARLLETLARPRSLPADLGADPRVRACLDPSGPGDCFQGNHIPLHAPDGALLPYEARGRGQGSGPAAEGSRVPYDTQGRACAPSAPVGDCPYEIEARLVPRCEGKEPSCARASSFALEVEVSFREASGRTAAPGTPSRRVRAYPPLSATVVVDARALESILYETARAAAPIPRSPETGVDSGSRSVSGEGGLPTLRSPGAGAVLPALPLRPGWDVKDVRRAHPPPRPPAPGERADSE